MNTETQSAVKTDNDDIYCSEILVHNCDGMCSEKYCSKEYTRYFMTEINGMSLYIPLCDEHAEKIEEKYFR